MNDALMTAIRERVEEEKRAAYAQGWRDAVAAIVKGANNLAGGPIMQGASEDALKQPREKSAQWYLLETLKSNPTGLSGLQLVSAARRNGSEASTASLRVAMGRLAEKKLIVKSDGKWFPA